MGAGAGEVPDSNWGFAAMLTDFGRGRGASFFGRLVVDAKVDAVVAAVFDINAAGAVAVVDVTAAVELDFFSPLPALITATRVGLPEPAPFFFAASRGANGRLSCRLLTSYSTRMVSKLIAVVSKGSVCADDLANRQESGRPLPQ